MHSCSAALVMFAASSASCIDRSRDVAVISLYSAFRQQPHGMLVACSECKDICAMHHCVAGCAVVACLCHRRVKRRRQVSGELNGAFAPSASDTTSMTGSKTGGSSASTGKRVQHNPFADNPRDSLEAAYVIKVRLFLETCRAACSRLWVSCPVSHGTSPRVTASHPCLPVKRSIIL